jgi:biopolymer transport protein ExbD
MTPATRAVPTSEVNVTPMLDVLLVLLIIFMAVTVPVHRTVDAHLPAECPGVCESTPQIVLEVLPGPTYRINQAPVSASDLATRLRAIFENRPEKIIYVSGDRRSRYQEVVSAMDVAKTAGVRVLSIAPNPRR